MTHRANSFGSAAESYDRHRPAYPEELIDHVLAYAGQQAEQGVLDVGAGTGKATLLLASSGLTVATPRRRPRSRRHRGNVLEQLGAR